jgi:hypothetical protein
VPVVKVRGHRRQSKAPIVLHCGKSIVVPHQVGLRARASEISTRIGWTGAAEVRAIAESPDGLKRQIR